MPAVTDVSGVSVQLSAGRFGSAFLNWPGVDRGASQAGFSNNAAFSLLSLNVQEFGQVRVESSTPTGNDAIYVQVLDLQGPFADALTNGIVDELVLAETIDLAPGMRIYFAAASAGAGTVDVSTLLDGALGGRLRLVRPAGSVAPDLIRTVRVADGAYVRVPARLLVSATVDSDGDGIPNAVDATPFSGVSLSSGPETINGERFFRLEWNAAPNTTYEIQSADSAAGGAWSRIGSMSNTSAGTNKLRFHDPISGSAAKVYRIVYSP
jgi:hypothetical protein